MGKAEPETKLYSTVLHFGEARTEEKRSVFIGSAMHVSSVDEAMDFVKTIKSKYSDATHNVYAYLIGSCTTRYSDDGEPSGTAGMPVLNVISKSGITDTAVVVTRYFGGTLLGTGGLVRAYSDCAREAVMAAEIAHYEPYAVLDMACNYSDYQKIQNEISKYTSIINKTEFSDIVKLEIEVRKEESEKFISSLAEITSARTKVEIKEERNELVK